MASFVHRGTIALKIQETIWITGASSGIGEALASEYAAPGVRLILSGRSEDKLQAVADTCTNKGAEAIVFPLDISITDQLEAKVESLREMVDRVDVLVNNAGISQRSKVLETSLSTHRKLMEINYFGTIELARLVLEWMIEKGGGTMAVMSSITGRFGFPLRSSYSASKHAILGFFGAMDLEYSKHGIKVCMILPGRINTPISLSALKGDGSQKGTMDKGLAGGMDVRKCARKIKRAIRRGKYITYITRKEIILVWIYKFFPSLFRLIARRINPE